MSVKDSVFLHIREYKMSSEIWTTIKNLYQTQNTSRIMVLKRKLFSMRMDERETPTAFVARIKDVKDKLADIGEAVFDSDLVSITLSGMRDEFQIFITGLVAREKAPTFEDLTGILLQEEEQWQNLNPQSDDLALMKQPDDKRKQASAKHRGYFVEEEEDFSHEFRLFTVDCALSASNEDDIWYVDSKASSHMTRKKEFFDNLEESTNGSKNYLGDDSGYEIKGYGEIPVKLSNGKISHLKNVLYVPGIKKNLISVSMMTDQDMQVEFSKTHCVIKECRNEIVATGMRVGSLYRLDAKSIPKRAMVAGGSTAEQLWHKRFGHLNLQELMLLHKKGMVEELPIFRNIQLNCDGCALGKMNREQFHVHDKRKVTDVLELVHTDVQEGKDDIGDDWHIPLLLEESSEDETEQEQKEEQKEQEEGDNVSPVIAEENKFEVSPLPRRSVRKTQKPLKLRDYALMSNVLNIVDPTNYKEASQSKEWRDEMNEEMESILRNDTWDLVDLPKNKTPIGCKWLFKPKMNADGSIEKLKARLVAKGYS
eukprot:PITA_14991